MPSLMELTQERHAAMTKADAILKSAESTGRALTAAEDEQVTSAMAEVEAINPRIAVLEKQNTLRSMYPNGIMRGVPGGSNVTGTATGNGKKTLSQDYFNAFHDFIKSGGQSTSAALYEGAGSAGGFAVPITVSGEIVPLAPAETGVRAVATVIPTTNDLRIPRKATNGTAAAKAESGATTNTFMETAPTLDEFTLSAYMAGAFEKISFEIAQDVPAFQSFCVADLLNAQQQVEEGWYVSGSGVGQPQGLLGNVGAGVTEEPDAQGNLVTLDGTLDLTGTLNAVYHANASWLMTRPTSILIRKAARQANLFDSVFTRVGGQDFLHGYPVNYTAAMPGAARGTTPLLFGDFKQGYIVGDRGGNGINVKILDQPLALQGQIAVLAYRRTDGRVRRSEAIQSYNIAAS